MVCEKSPARWLPKPTPATSPGTVFTALLALRLSLLVKLRKNDHLSLLTRCGMRIGPPKFPVIVSVAEEGFGWALPLRENGAAFRAELVAVMAMEP